MPIKAEALRQAQIAMIKGQVSIAAVIKRASRFGKYTLQNQDDPELILFIYPKLVLSKM
jgi:CHAT domain-containing protein